MRKVLAILLSIGALIAIGCAAVQKPLPPAQQEEFFVCRKASLTDAESNLVLAGFPITQKSATYVQTGYMQFDETGEAEAILLNIRATMSFRVSVVSLGSDVRFTAFGLASQQAVHGSAATNTQNSEKQLAVLTEEQVANSRSRRTLNRLHKAVCGGPDFFDL